MAFGGNKDEMAVTMAALCLYDGGAEITSDNISALLEGANVAVAPYWPALFAGALKNGAIEKLLFTVGGGGGGGGGAAAAAPAAGAAAAASEAPAAKAAAPKEEEVDALEGGMDMFGGGGGGGGDY